MEEYNPVRTVTRNFHCYNCNHDSKLTINPTEAFNVKCSKCKSDFLEEIDNLQRNVPINPNTSYYDRMYEPNNGPEINVNHPSAQNAYSNTNYNSNSNSNQQQDVNFQKYDHQPAANNAYHHSNHQNNPHHQGHKEKAKTHSKKQKKTSKTPLNSNIPSNNFNEANAHANNFSDPSYGFNHHQTNGMNNPFLSNSSNNISNNANYAHPFNFQVPENPFLRNNPPNSNVTNQSNLNFNHPNQNFPKNPFLRNSPPNSNATNQSNFNFNNPNQNFPQNPFFRNNPPNSNATNESNYNFNNPNQNFPPNPFQEFINPQNMNFQSNEQFNYNQPHNVPNFAQNFQPSYQNSNPFSNQNAGNQYNSNANLNEEEKHRIPNQTNFRESPNRNIPGQHTNMNQGNQNEENANSRAHHRNHRHRGGRRAHRVDQNPFFDFNSFNPFIDIQSIFSSFFGDNLGGEIVFEYPMENFGINYLSNFHDNPDILNFIQDLSFNDNGSHSRPVKKSVLKKIRTFPLSENNCKKNDKGVLEMPTCSVCFNQMKLKENVMLLPCGHMYHPNCLKPWFENNNTCPVCRFELPSE